MSPFKLSTVEKFSLTTQLVLLNYPGQFMDWCFAHQITHKTISSWKMADRSDDSQPEGNQ